MNLKKAISILCLAVILLLTACSQTNNASSSNNSSPEANNTEAEQEVSTGTEEKKDIKFGVIGVTEIAFNAAAPEFEKLGYNVEMVLFDSVMLAVNAVNDGSVDIMLAPHIHFMENFNQQEGGDLVMMEPYTYYSGIGLYSEKYDSVDDFPEGAQIGIMNDAMNMDIGMKILRDVGLITLKDTPDGVYTTLDIAENPKNIELIEMDQGQSARSLSDLDASLVWFTSMHFSGKDVTSYLARDMEADKYPISPIVKEANKDAQWAKDLTKCFKVDSVEEKIDEELPNVYMFYEYDEASASK